MAEHGIGTLRGSGRELNREGFWCFWIWIGGFALVFRVRPHNMALCDQRYATITLSFHCTFFFFFFFCFFSSPFKDYSFLDFRGFYFYFF
jgi:hypothetical protein